MRFVAVAIVASLTCTPAFADVAAPAKEKRFCKRGSSLGSHLRPPKICRTAAEWKEIADADRAAQMKFRNDVRGGERPPEGLKTGVN